MSVPLDKLRKARTAEVLEWQPFFYSGAPSARQVDLRVECFVRAYFRHGTCRVSAIGSLFHDNCRGLHLRAIAGDLPRKPRRRPPLPRSADAFSHVFLVEARYGASWAIFRGDHLGNICLRVLVFANFLQVYVLLIFDGAVEEMYR